MTGLRFTRLAGFSTWLILGSALTASATTLALDGSWLMLDELMQQGQYFTGTGTSYPDYPTLGGSGSGTGTWDINLAQRFEWTSTVPVQLDITDWSAATDRFKIWIDAFDPSLPLAVLSGGIQWLDVPGCDENGYGTLCRWTYDPNEALADPAFASGSFVIGPGSHALVIQAYEIPYHYPDPNGPRYPDSTAAIRVAPIPEPGTLLLVGSGVAASLAHRRRRKLQPANN